MRNIPAFLALVAAVVTSATSRTIAQEWVEDSRATSCGPLAVQGSQRVVCGRPNRDGQTNLVFLRSRSGIQGAAAADDSLGRKRRADVSTTIAPGFRLDLDDQHAKWERIPRFPEGRASSLISSHVAAMAGRSYT